MSANRDGPVVGFGAFFVLLGLSYRLTFSAGAGGFRGRHNDELVVLPLCPQDVPVVVRRLETERPPFAHGRQTARCAQHHSLGRCIDRVRRLDVE